jgi:hypothetical protein
MARDTVQIVDFRHAVSSKAIYYNPDHGITKLTEFCLRAYGQELMLESAALAKRKAELRREVDAIAAEIRSGEADQHVQETADKILALNENLSNAMDGSDAKPFESVGRISSHVGRVASRPTDKHSVGLQKELEEVWMKEMMTYMEKAWALLTPKQQDEVAAGLHSALKKAMSGGSQLKAIQTFVEDMVQSELAAREAEIRTRVAGEVNERWEGVVAQVVEAKLAEAVRRMKDELRRELAKP